MKHLTLYVYLLNLLDLGCTLCVLSFGGRELNPLMRHPAVMVAWKVFGVGALCLWLSTRSEAIAVQGMKLCAAVYELLWVYHFVLLLRIMGGLRK